MLNVFIEFVTFYAIKKALNLPDDKVKHSFSPFCLNAKVDYEYSKCKQIVIYNDYKEVDIFFEGSVSDGTVTEIGKFGIVTIKPIKMPDEDELRVTPIVKDGVCLHMSWR